VKSNQINNEIPLALFISKLRSHLQFGDGGSGIGDFGVVIEHVETDIGVITPCQVVISHKSVKISRNLTMTTQWLIGKKMWSDIR